MTSFVAKVLGAVCFLLIFACWLTSWNHTVSESRSDAIAALNRLQSQDDFTQPLRRATDTAPFESEEESADSGELGPKEQEMVSTSSSTYLDLDSSKFRIDFKHNFLDKPRPEPESPPPELI